jgi:phage shock protein E
VTTRTRLAALALVALVPLAACSSGDDGGSTADTTAAAAAESGDQSAAAPGVVLVSAADAQAVLESRPDVVTLDVRTPQEFAEGHLAGAQLLDYTSGEFAARLGELDPGATYVLYCRSGNRSAGAAELMRQAGFTEVYEVDGGILAWEAAGLPVEA